MIHPSMIIVAIGLGLAIGGASWGWTAYSRAAHQRCTFDRNELGPQGDHGQWWWDIYKCPDGTERRVLVAGPRG